MNRRFAGIALIGMLAALAAAPPRDDGPPVSEQRAAAADVATIDSVMRFDLTVVNLTPVSVEISTSAIDSANAEHVAAQLATVVGLERSRTLRTEALSSRSHNWMRSADRSPPRYLRHARPTARDFARRLSLST